MLRPILCSALMAAFTISPAHARSCGDRAAIVERLAAEYGETRVGAGLVSNNRVVEIFASPDTGTWTIIVTVPAGQSCLVHAGEGWQDDAWGAPVGDAL